MPSGPRDLLRSGARAKWIGRVDQHADEWAQTLFTRDHDVIRAWARERMAGPAVGEGGVSVPDAGSKLRLGFPGMTQLHNVSWEDWFQEFDRHDLVFAFRERRDDGQVSQDYRIITRNQLDADGPQPPPRNDPP